MRIKRNILQMFEQRITHPQWKLSDFSITPTTQVTVKHTTHGYQITARLPGIKPEQITSNILEDRVALETHASDEAESEQKGSWHLHENRNNSYTCTITFNKPIDVARATSHYTPGALTIILPLKGNDHPT